MLRRLEGEEYDPLNPDVDNVVISPRDKENARWEISHVKMTSLQPRGVRGPATEGLERLTRPSRSGKKAVIGTVGPKPPGLGAFGRGPNATHHGGEDRSMRAKEGRSGGPSDVSHGD